MLELILMKKLFLALSLFTGALAIAASVFFVSQAVSAQTADQAERQSTRESWEARPLKEQVKLFQQYLALSACFANSPLKDGNNDRINPVNATLFQWFNEPGLTGEGTVTYVGDNLGSVSVGGVQLGSMLQCYSGDAIRGLLSSLGQDVSNPIRVLCKLGFDRNKKGSPDGAGGGCLSADGEGDFYWKGQSRTESLKTFVSVFSNQFWGGSVPYLTKPAEYQRYSDLFALCATRADDRPIETINALKSTDRGYEIYVIDPLTGDRSEGKIFHYGAEGSGKTRNETVAIGGGYATGGNALLALFGTGLGPLGILQANTIQNAVTMFTGSNASKLTCAELESKLNEDVLSELYAGFVKDIVDSGGSLEDGVGSGCDVSGGISCEGEETSCVIVSIGWLICPVVNFLAGIADGAFDVLATSFLQTDPRLLDTEDSPTYDAWAVMRNLANVAFVIVFLIIIFSQLSSLGISNYGVKKMVPRLIVAAILVNVSFFLCQLAVDLSNIAGYSLVSIFESLGAQAIGDTPASNASVSGFDTDSTTFGNIAAGILTGGVAIAVLYTALGTLIPVLVAAAISLLMILFILVARQALIVLLIVLSPLAFVAFLLPNTEGLFKKWRQALIAMLMLFPLVAVVFGASSFASTILGVTFSGGLGDGDPDNFFGQIIAAAVLTLPLFVVPILLKKSLDNIGNIGGIINGLGNKAGGFLGRKAGEGYNKSSIAQAREAKKNAAASYRAQRTADRMGKKGFTRLASMSLPIGKKGKYMNTAVGRIADNAADDLQEKEVRAAEGKYKAMSQKQVRAELSRALETGDHVSAKAAQNNLMKSASGRREYKGAMRQFESDAASGKVAKSVHAAGLQAMSSNILRNHGDVKGKDNAIMQHAIDVANNTKGGVLDTSSMAGGLDHHESASETYSGLSDAEIAGQPYENLMEAIGSGKVTADQASRILSNDNISLGVGGKERDVLQWVAGGKSGPAPTGPTGGSGGPTPAAGGPSGPTGGGGPTVGPGPAPSGGPSGPAGGAGPTSGGGGSTGGGTSTSTAPASSTPTSSRRASSGGTVTPAASTPAPTISAAQPTQQTTTVTVGSNGSRRVQTSGTPQQASDLTIDHSDDTAPAEETISFQYGDLPVSTTISPSSDAALATDISSGGRESINITIAGQEPSDETASPSGGRRASAPQQSTVSAQDTALDNGLYRLNSVGAPIRPEGTSGNDGAFISLKEKEAIDTRADDIVRNAPRPPEDNGSTQ